MHFQSPPPYTTLVGPFARTVHLFAYYVLLTLRLAIIPNFPTVIDAVSSANPVSAADFTPWALRVISAPQIATFHKELWRKRRKGRKGNKSEKFQK